MQAPVPHPFFLPVDGIEIFCLHYTTGRGTPRGAVLYLHPFAEEMNKSRRMAALQSRRFAQAGWEVLQLDLSGCGDSQGEFGDTGWDRWLTEAVAALDWLRGRVDGPIWLWGLRAGALIASHAARRAPPPVRLLLWQPLTSGARQLQQILRLRVAGAAIGGEKAASGVRELRKRIAAGNAEEIAGYVISPTLATGLEQADLLLPAGDGRVGWLEVSHHSDAGVLPASREVIERWRGAGCRVESAVVSGQPFWQTVEIAECPDLLTATMDCFERLNA